ncbi:MAG: ABC transporter ATP-binding protein [Oscillospiraceae bacterium]|nr:ABC transporter ATP-binding protein [Oscillospiraceae bacterium]
MIYEIKEVSFAYPASSKQVLNGVSFTLEEGEILSILGRNGAGKSTLLGCMLGMLKPQAGSVLLAGRDIASMNEREIACVTGYVPQIHIPSFSFSVMDFVLMGCASQIGLFSKPGKKERKAAIKSLCELGIESLAERPYTGISGGERQKATIARAIVSNPKAVLFDEPTAHLDYGSQIRVLRIIGELSRKGYSVVITTHNPDHALLLGGRAALMDDNGTLIIGDSKDVIIQSNLSRLYDADVRLEYIESIGRTVCVHASL